jgi:hypothetical protein
MKATILVLALSTSIAAEPTGTLTLALRAWEMAQCR